MSGRIIVLKGSPIVKEARAGGAGILPGHKLDLAINAGVLEVDHAAVADENDSGRNAYAVEADVVGNTAADVYGDNDQVKYVVGRSGDEIQVRAATTLTWVVGAPLYGAAAGQVTDVNPGATGVASQPIGYALSSETTTTADDLVPMEVA